MKRSTIQLRTTRGTPNCSHEYIKVDSVAIQDANFLFNWEELKKWDFKKSSQHLYL